MAKILIADDALFMRLTLGNILKEAGYEVCEAKNGREMIQVYEQEQPDLIMLDITMPEMDGFEFLQCLRACSDTTPVLMLSAKSLAKDKCKGFTLGADDYVIKPIHEEELLLRIKAILRRSQIAHEHKLQIGKIILDYQALTVTREDYCQTLPQKEFYLLYKLLSYPNNIFTRIQLMDEIWGMSSESTDTTINVHIARLRRRFESWPEFEIQAIRGIGYKAVIHVENY